MTRLKAALFILALVPSFFWSREPELQVGPNPPRGTHMEYRSYPAAGYTLSDGHNSIVLPDGTLVVIRYWSRTRQQDWPNLDSLRVATKENR